MRAFSSCGERGLLSVAVRRLLIVVASLVVEHGLQARGLQKLWCADSVVVARGPQSTGSVVVAHGLVALRHVGSSRTRDQTRVPYIGRWILNHCATREPLPATLFPDSSPGGLCLKLLILSLKLTFSKTPSFLTILS